MRHLIMMVIPVFFLSVVSAQTPSDKLFEKYGDKNGVDLSVVSQPPVYDSLKTRSVTTVIKTMTVNNDDEEKAMSKLFRQIGKDCLKLLRQKEYAEIISDKEDGEIFKAHRYAKDGILELCVFENDGEELTLTSTQIKGMTENEMKDFKINIEK